MSTTYVMIYDLPPEVLRLVPRTYREWALLAMTSKALAGRLGDYHEACGYTFHDGTTLDAERLTYKRYVDGLLKPRVHGSFYTARDNGGRLTLITSVFANGEHTIYVHYRQRDGRAHVTTLYNSSAVCRTRYMVGDRVYYIDSKYINVVVPLLRDGLPALRITALLN